MASSLTAFGSADQLGSQWPAGLQYNPRESKYVYSVSNAFQISALAHVHVIDIDVPQVGSVPNVMSLTLPVMRNLPLESRIYFFYVTNSTAGDQLTFIPVALSGNTVNGNAVSFTFVLSGSPELYIALGVQDNYIIHAFGRNNPGPTNLGLPTEYYDYNEEIFPIVGPTYSDLLFTAATKDLYAGNGSVAASVTVVTGMEGFLSREIPVPTQLFRGYRCNTTGMYLVNPQFEARLYYTAGADASNLGALQANFLEFNADGSYSKASTAPAFVPFRSVPDPSPVGLAGLLWDATDVTITTSPILNPFGLGNVMCFPDTASFPAAQPIGSNAEVGAFSQASWGGGLYYGFRCNQEGFWGINFHSKTVCDTDNDSLAVGLGSAILVITAGGTLKNYFFGNQVQAGTVGLNPSTIYVADEVKVSLEVGDIVAVGSQWFTAAGIESCPMDDTYLSFLFYGFQPVPNPPLPPEDQIDFRYNTSFLFPMEANKFYVPSFTWDDTSEGTIDPSLIRGNITFVYWADFVTPGPELMLALRSAASSSEPSLAAHAKAALAQVQAANTNPEVYAPMSKPLSGPKATIIQRSRIQEKSLSDRRNIASSSSSSSQQPLFSLSDMERMINQALDARQVRSSPASSSSSSSVASSSSSSSIISAAPPDPKKRKLSISHRK